MYIAIAVIYWCGRPSIQCGRSIPCKSTIGVKVGYAELSKSMNKIEYERKGIIRGIVRININKYNDTYKVFFAPIEP